MGDRLHWGASGTRVKHGLARTGVDLLRRGGEAYHASLLKGRKIMSGYCLAGGTELAQSCDLVYVAEDARIGYPVVRNISPPDNNFYPWIVGMRKAMHLMLTGDSMTGEEAVRYGFANEAFSAEDLEAQVLHYAERVASVPQELTQFNKRTVHRQMDLMGIRAAIRASTDTQQLASMSKPAREFFKQMAERGLTKALNGRDSKFGDYRTSGSQGEE